MNAIVGHLFSVLVHLGMFGLLGIFFHRQILSLARSSAVRTGILALVVLCIVVSALSVIAWIRRGRSEPAPVSAR